MTVLSSIDNENPIRTLHRRSRLPIRVEAKGTAFTAVDWSDKDIAIRDASHFMEGETLDVTLVVPFDGYGFSLQARGEVRNISAPDQRTAIGLVDLDDRQQALLRYLLEQSATGHIFSAGHVLDVAGRTGTTGPRAEATSPPGARERFRISGRRLASTAGVTAILFALGAYLWTNVYQELYVVQAESAQVLAKTVNVAAPAVGRIGYINDKPEVSLGDPILTVMPAVGDPITVQSPCDCLQVDQAFASGDFVKTGEPVIRLRRADAPVVVSAIVPGEEIMSLYGRNSASIRYADGRTVHDAAILWLPGRTDPSNSLPRQPSSVLLDPKRAADTLMIGEPVEVSFDRFAGSVPGQLWSRLAARLSPDTALAAQDRRGAPVAAVGHGANGS